MKRSQLLAISYAKRERQRKKIVAAGLYDEYLKYANERKLSNVCYMNFLKHIKRIDLII